MLYLMGIIVGLLFIIMCFSKGLKEGNKTQRSALTEFSAYKKILLLNALDLIGPEKVGGALKAVLDAPGFARYESSYQDLSEEDIQLLARILALGLVDADPNYLQHLKGYRDLLTDG